MTKGRRKALRRYHERLRLRKPHVVRAQLMAQRAKKRGRLQSKPCQRCGSAEHITMHHPDYSKPLEVQWLCQPCHTKVELSKSQEVT